MCLSFPLVRLVRRHRTARRRRLARRRRTARRRIARCRCLVYPRSRSSFPLLPKRVVRPNPKIRLH